MFQHKDSIEKFCNLPPHAGGGGEKTKTILTRPVRLERGCSVHYVIASCASTIDHTTELGQTERSRGYLLVVIVAGSDAPDGLRVALEAAPLVEVFNPGHFAAAEIALDALLAEDERTPGDAGKNKSWGSGGQVGSAGS